VKIPLGGREERKIKSMSKMKIRKKMKSRIKSKSRTGSAGPVLS
jgi:hypothetical protein